jgi:hypothetical protein
MRRALLLVALSAILGCEGGLEDRAPLPPLDEAYFRCHVQPVLTESCSMFACHGDGSRYFRIYARNRLRYGIAGEAQRNAQLNDAERAFNFASARAFIDVSARDRSLLLKKPLEIDAGGAFHRGATLYGAGNVFSTEKSADYQTLLKWIDGAKEDPQCIEPGSDQ